MSWLEVISMKTIMYEDTNEEGETVYGSPDGWTMKREDFVHPNGELYTGVWVLRQEHGFRIDFDQYRFDLEARNKIRLVSSVEQDNS